MGPYRCHRRTKLRTPLIFYRFVAAGCGIIHCARSVGLRCKLTDANRTSRTPSRLWPPIGVENAASWTARKSNRLYRAQPLKPGRARSQSRVIFYTDTRPELAETRRAP